MRITNLTIRHLVENDGSGNGSGRKRLEADFLEVQTDIGVSGLYGPIRGHVASIAVTELRQHIIDSNPLKHEVIWHDLYRMHPHGHTGYYVMALSAVDCALWDLHGKILGIPVYELLGGPSRRAVPCYASMIGFDPDSVESLDLALTTRDQGFIGQKWPLRDGPEDGYHGLLRNIRRVERLRETLGYDYPLMLDAFGRWNRHYTIEFARHIHQLNVTWLEEPLPPALGSSLTSLRRACGVPLAAGEHLYTRYEAHNLLRTEAIDYLQPDVGWCGGISEAGKIAAIASVWGIPLVPHGAGLIPALHLAAVHPPTLIPSVEYHMTLADERLFFFSERLAPIDGMIPLPTGPGLGFTVDLKPAMTT